MTPLSGRSGAEMASANEMVEHIVTASLERVVTAAPADERPAPAVAPVDEAAQRKTLTVGEPGLEERAATVLLRNSHFLRTPSM